MSTSGTRTAEGSLGGLTRPLHASYGLIRSLLPWITLILFVLTAWTSTVLFPGTELHAWKLLHAAVLIIEFSMILILAPEALKRRDARALFLPTAAYSLLVCYASFRHRQNLGFLEKSLPVEVGLNIWALMVFLPCGLRRRDYFRIFFGLSVVFAISSATCLGLAFMHRESFLGATLLHHYDHRGGAWSAQGFYLHRNTLGAFLEFFPALIGILLIESGVGRMTKAVLWTSLGLITLNLALSFSRSSQGVALFSVGLPLLLFVFRRWGHRISGHAKIGLIAGVILFAAGFILVFPGFAWSLVYLYGRDHYWMEILHQLPLQIWFGYGVLGVTTKSHDTPHNVYLAQLAYYGVVGLLAFLWLFVKTAHLVWAKIGQGFKNCLAKQLLAALLVGLVLQGCVEYMITYPLFFTNSLFLLLVGYAWSAPS